MSGQLNQCASGDHCVGYLPVLSLAALSNPSQRLKAMVFLALHAANYFEGLPAECD